jgi:glycosyltransferase involved in cell wall biosynthesis
LDGDIEFSFIPPCLNEARTLPTCIAKAQQAIRAQSVSAEIIVADNDSTDGSSEIAKSLGAGVVPVSSGATVRRRPAGP